jgi:ADP-ribose pyrophosphatase YjhB (NUDIX family)
MAEKVEREREEVTVNRREVREEIGQSPGLPVDTYRLQTHVDNSQRIYGVEPYVVHMALSYLQQTDPDNYNPDRLTIDQVKRAINKALDQEWRPN